MLSYSRLGFMRGTAGLHCNARDPAFGLCHSGAASGMRSCMGAWRVDLSSSSGWCWSLRNLSPEQGGAAREGTSIAELVLELCAVMLASFSHASACLDRSKVAPCVAMWYAGRKWCSDLVVACSGACVRACVRACEVVGWLVCFACMCCLMWWRGGGTNTTSTKGQRAAKQGGREACLGRSKKTIGDGG